MEKEWHRIISLNGSQANAFEELVCQLAMNERDTQLTVFERVGTPDGGVECYWRLKNGQECGWQAKYYEQLSSSEWNGIKNSLLDAVETHQNLTRYVIAIPHNLSDARRGKKTQKSIWDQYKQQWTTELLSFGRSVELVLWPSSIIFSKLLKPCNEGIRTFFFEEIEIREENLYLHLDAAIANLGPKYSPDLNFKLDDLPKNFDALTRNQRFQNDFTERLNTVLQHLNTVINSALQYPKTRDQVVTIQTHYDNLVALYNSVDFIPSKQIPVENYTAQLKFLVDSIRPLYKLYEEIEKEYREEQKKKETQEKTNPQSYNDTSNRLQRKVRDLDECTIQSNKFVAYLHCPLVRAANEGVLFLKGMPGTGKSHLLADIAMERKESKVPSIFLLGEHFTKQPPKNFIQQSLSPSKPLEAYLQALESLARSKNQRILFIIDAINEGFGTQIWKRHIAGFVKELQAFKWIGFVFSYRTTFEDVLMPENFNPPLITHNGFEGIEYEATKRFFQYYKIQQPAIPILNPEFSNPLFLKTFCISLNKAGMTTIPQGYEGISKILEAFITAINKNIAERLSYNPRINLVQKAIDLLVRYQIDSGNMIIPWEETYLLLEPLLKQFSSSTGFLDEIIKEGLLIEDYYYDRNTKKYEQHGVVFNYERFNEHLKAIYLLNSYSGVSALKKAFIPSGKLYKFFGDKRGYSGLNAGLLNAFAIVIPEKFGVEIYEVLKIKDTYAAKRIYDAFLQSLLWRRHDSIKASSWEYVKKFIPRQTDLVEFYNTILLLAANPSHYYNADFLHTFLKDRSVAERDLIWSIQIDKVWQWYQSNSVKRIIDWAWSPEDKMYISDDAIRLLGVTLAWLFTNSNRRIRDKATKAFATLFIDKVHLLKPLIESFSEINDPYVLERLLAGSYGAIVHSKSMEDNCTVAQYIYDSFFSKRKPPLNINTREYAKCIIEWVSAAGGKFRYSKRNLYPPFNYPFPTDIPGEEWVQTVKINKAGEYTDEERGQSQITFSVLSWDFARYILGTNYGNAIPYSNYTIESKQAYSKLEKALKGTVKEMLKMYVDSTILYNGSGDLGKKMRRSFRGEQLDKQLRFIKEGNQFAAEYLEQNLTGKEREWFSKAKAYIETGFETQRYYKKRFPSDVVQRYIIKRVFDLGWNKEWFGAYDAGVQEANRKADKPERIGKKYQWIAYYEIMALLSDNYDFISRYEDGDKPYKGTWQHMLRNIDPSALNTFKGESEVFETTWYQTQNYSNWKEDRSTWLGRFNDMPDLSKIVVCVDPFGEQWYLLYNHMVWKSGSPLGKDRHDTGYKELWLDISAYLVTKNAQSSLFNRGSQEHFRLGQNAPDTPNYYNVYWGEWYHGDAYNFYIDDRYPDYPYDRFSTETKSFKIIPTAEDYGFSDEYDLSGEKLKLYRPTRFLFELLQGNTGRNDACIYDSAGNIIAMDPGVYFDNGQRCLLVKKKALDKALEKNELELIWFFSGEKEDVGPLISYVYRMLYSGFIRFENGIFKIAFQHERETQNE